MGPWCSWLYPALALYYRESWIPEVRIYRYIAYRYPAGVLRLQRPCLLSGPIMLNTRIEKPFLWLEAATLDP